jgi:uncharacterized protein YeaO (DUF488 family)
MIQIKRAYEPAVASDGRRVLVERLWPRGLRKEDAHLDDWLKDVAPSDSLRKWFGHEPARFPEFRERYKRELRSATSKGPLDQLAHWAAREKVTLVYSARDEEHNSALVLAGELERRFRRPSKPTATRLRSRATSRGRPRVGRGR